MSDQEVRTDHRVTIVKCGHPAVDAEAMLMDDVNFQGFTCRELRNDDRCPDANCLGWVD